MIIMVRKRKYFIAISVEYVELVDEKIFSIVITVAVVWACIRRIIISVKKIYSRLTVLFVLMIFKILSINLLLQIVVILCILIV